jgi:RNA polymerase sigma-70 factor (ECF subfamily)
MYYFRPFVPVDRTHQPIYTSISASLNSPEFSEFGMNEPPQDITCWISAARGGSQDALGNALESCRRYLLAAARLELNADLRAKGGASDLVQETFLEAQQIFDRFHGESAIELRAWLRRLLHHRATKFSRRFRDTKKRRLARETAPVPAGSGVWDGGPRAAEPSPSTHVIATEQAQRLQQALERLPHDYRRVITLRYVEQCQFEEIGRLMQRTPNAARLLWLRAIERIKHEMRGSDEP